MKKHNKYTLSDTLTILLGCALIIAILGVFVETIQAEKDNQELDIFYMYGNRTGAYFLEPQAEYENLIYVSQSDLNDWDITPTEPGQKFIGTFDAAGWELLNLKHKEETK